MVNTPFKIMEGNEFNTNVHLAGSDSEEANTIASQPAKLIAFKNMNINSIKARLSEIREKTQLLPDYSTLPSFKLKDLIPG